MVLGWDQLCLRYLSQFGPPGPSCLELPLAKRPVELGRVFNGVAVVMSGLRVGEPVVVADTFFLDAERRLRADRDPSVKGMP